MTIEIKGMDGAAVAISPEALGAFKAAFKGQVLAPGDAAYEETRQVWNAMIDRRPGLIARCTGTWTWCRPYASPASMGCWPRCAAAATTSRAWPCARAAS